MHPATVKTEGYQDPSLGLDTVFVCQLDSRRKEVG